MAFDCEQKPYRDLRDGWKTRTMPIVAWVGAGMSAPAGIPLWGRLRADLEKEAQAVADKLPDDERDARRLKALLNLARVETSPWKAFQQLEEVLGTSSYEATVRRLLTPDRKKGIPENYLRLWRLRPTGIVDLNLDGLSVQAHAAVLKGTERISAFEAKDVASRVHLVKSASPWVARLHGSIDARQSWVFNNRELDDLFSVAGYREFITTLFLARTNVFVGMGADDVAAGGHLNNLTGIGLRTGEHYWITHRDDIATREWAERAGLRVIVYQAKAGIHDELDEILEDLLQHVPKDATPQPIRPETSLASHSDLETLPTPSEMQGKEPEEIRALLNARAMEILTDTADATFSEYEAFVRSYNRAITLAWNVEDFTPDNVLFGYRIERKIGEGAFARVFEARAPDGKRVAIKLLHDRVRRDQPMLSAFRRGVSSMRILAKHGVEGMVPYHEAAEIPAMVVMDFIDGPNLTDAVASRQIGDWSTILRIASDLVNIILRGHRLPERVLHRDIRPSNVMLERFYYGEDDWEVLVLDFDLSWHRDAQDESIALPSAKFGYLAPEQLTRRPGISTRNASVDSFGIGMTLRHLATGLHPSPGEHQRSDWRTRLVEEVAGRRPARLSCLPRLFAHIVYMCTLDDQSSRWDLSQVQAELTVLDEAERNIGKLASPRILTEELASRSKHLATRYSRGERENDIVASFLRGPKVTLHPVEDRRKIELELNWVSDGMDSRKMLNKWLRAAADQAISVLRGSPYSSLKHDAGSGTAWVGGMLEVPISEQQLDAAAVALDAAIEKMTLE